MPAPTPKRKAPHGSWPSPLTPERVLSARTSLRHGLGQIAIDGDNVYWIEGRPHEGGRNVVVCRRPAGSVHDASPPGVSVRTRAHEYGGGDFTVSGSLLYYVDDANQGVFVLDLRGGAPRQLTPLQTAGEDRYADFVVDRERRRPIAGSPTRHLAPARSWPRVPTSTPRRP